MPSPTQLIARRPIVPIALATALWLAVAAASLLLFWSNRSPDSEPARGRFDCPPGRSNQVVAYFNTDEEMAAAADAPRGDGRVAELATETLEQAYERFKEVFADDPELSARVGPGDVPASVTIRPAGISIEKLAGQLTTELTAATEVRAVPCATAVPLPTGGQ